MHVGGAAYRIEDAEERDIHRVVTEWHAEALARVLAAAVVGEPHWRREAKALLKRIDNRDIGTEPKR
jgi:hypothetical protein